MQEPTHQFLEASGIALPAYDPRKGSRDYHIAAERALFVVDRPKDLVTRVALGDLNAAIVGGDAVAEFKAEYAEQGRLTGSLHYQPSDLDAADLRPYLSWELVMLVRDEMPEPTLEALLSRLGRRDKRYQVASWTEYPGLEKELLHRTQPSMEVGIYPHGCGEVVIFPSAGTTESKLRRGHSMFGLEIVSSGETARANGLRPFPETAERFYPVLIKPRDYDDPFVRDFLSTLRG